MGLNKTLYEYQEKASNKLVEHSRQISKYLHSSDPDMVAYGQRNGIKLLSAPTGSGKTIIVSDVIIKTAAEWKDEGKDTIFVVLAPNSLNNQLQTDMKDNGIGSDGVLNPVSIQSVAAGQKIAPWDIVFSNYSSVDKKKNTVIVENERGTDMKTQMEKLKEDGVQVVLIADEAHVNYSGKQAQAFINDVLNPDITLLVTATPHKNIEGYVSESEQTVEVSREDAVSSGALVKQVILNNGIDQVSTNESDNEYRTANLKFVDMALTMSERLNQAYADEGSNVRCLVGIQIPSKTKSILEIADDHGERRKDNEQERQMLEYVLEHLQKKNPELYVTDTDDGKGDVNDKVAIWLAEQKTHNAEDDIIKPNDSHVDVIIFKAAIAVGWDCPRLSSGALLRESKTKPFIAQTGGRFTRMPEQQHYENELLNYAYLFTAYDLVRKIMVDDNHNNSNMGTNAPQEVGLRDDADSVGIVNAVKALGGLPYDHRQRNNNPVTSRDSIEKASKKFLESKGIDATQIGSGISTHDWSALGVNTGVDVSGMEVLEEQILDVDQIEGKYKSFVSKIDRSDEDRLNDYRLIIRSAAAYGALQLNETAKNMMKHIRANMLPRNVSDGSLFTEQDLADVVISDDANRVAFQRVVYEILELANEIQGGTGKPDKIQRRGTSWFIPESLWIDGQDSIECHECGVGNDSSIRPELQESLYECVDIEPASRPEKTYLSTVPKRIREILDDEHGGHVKHRYMKNGEQGSHFGIKYADDRGDHIFYPDFFHFFLINGRMHVNIIEVKEEGSSKGDTLETIRSKAQALEEYCQEMQADDVSVHGAIWAFGKPDSSSRETEVTVINGDRAKDETYHVSRVVELMIENTLGKA